LSISLPGSIRARIPTALRYAKKMLEDLEPSLSFILSRRKQRQALKEIDACRTVADYISFSSRWLGGGAMQIPMEIAGALDYVRTERPRYVCEIGTERCGTTLLLSRVLTSAELIIGIDIYVKNRYRLQFFQASSQKVHLLNGSSYALGTLRRVESILGEKKLDVLFIDGDHRYEGVRNDFLMYRHLVRENGFVLFHDIVPDHATRYGKRTPTFSGGVPILWEQLKAAYPCREFIRNPGQDGFGIGVLRYSSSIALPKAVAETTV